MPRICYGPIAIVSPIYEFHCDTAAHHQFGWLRRLVGLQCIRECVHNLYLFTVYSVESEGKRKGKSEREREEEWSYVSGAPTLSIDCILSVHTVMLL